MRNFDKFSVKLLPNRNIWNVCASKHWKKIPYSQWNFSKNKLSSPSIAPRTFVRRLAEEASASPLPSFTKKLAHNWKNHAHQWLEEKKTGKEHFCRFGWNRLQLEQHKQRRYLENHKLSKGSCFQRIWRCRHRKNKKTVKTNRQLTKPSRVLL